jgi:hypothetical protein
MPKVDYKDLEEITKFLDKLVKVFEFSGLSIKSTVIINKAKELSKMIKDNYTEIKPNYESTN